MDVGAVTPLLDLFRRTEVDREVRLMAAQCVLGLRPQEQLGILELLVDDPDPEVAQSAVASLRALTNPSTPPASAGGESEPSVATAPEGQDEQSALQKIAAMSPGQRLALAMRGTREERAILIRDPNKVVAAAVLSSPKLTDSEVEGIAKMASVSEEVLRTIGNARGWTKNYSIVAALTKNAKTPVAVSLTLLGRLHEKEIRILSSDRNIPDVVRLAARRRLAPK